MRPLYSSFFLSVVVHGLIFSIAPAKPVTKVVRLEEIRLDEKKPIRLVALVSPRPAPPSRSVPPPTPPSPRQERKKPFKKKPEEVIKNVEKLPPLLKEPEETREPLEEQVERPEPIEKVKAPEDEPVEKPETEVVGLDSEPAAEAPPLEAPPIAENVFGPPFPPFEAGETPQTASISTPTEEGEGLSHPAIERIRDDYLARLREKVESARFYPDRARRMGQEGRVVVRFVVRAGGQLERVDLAEPSSFPLLNQAAMETIRSLSSLPPLPPDFGDRMEVTIPLVYRLEQSARR